MLTNMVELNESDTFLENAENMEVLNKNRKRTHSPSQTVSRKRPKMKSLYRQPTVKELNRLQETETLFNSNLFRLQIEEILKEVNVSEKVTKKFQQWFAEFRSYLLSIPKDETDYNLSEKTLENKLKVKMPINSDLKKTKCTFHFHKFDDINIVGSYALNCAVNSHLTVDLQITVPSGTYNKTDSVNYRYHKKRAAYLAYITAHIKGCEIVEDVTYCWSSGCESKPMLNINPKGKVGKHLTVRLHLTCESNTYKLHRFSPLRNNLRDVWMWPDEAYNTNQTEVGSATPYYNSSILADITASDNMCFLFEILKNSDNLKQAIILIKIWLRQRKLQVPGFIVSLFVAYLVLNKRVNNIMSSYQIVRNVWIALKASEWDIKGITLYKGAEETPSIEEFHQNFPVVFVDTSGYFNLCWQMNHGTYQALKRESNLAVELLDNGKINSFTPLFMTKVLPLTQFDHIVKFKNLTEIIETVAKKASKKAQLNYGVDKTLLVVDIIQGLFWKGLHERVELVQHIVDADFSWPVNKSLDRAKSVGYKPKLSFGFIMNAENFMNLVDRGPQANLPEAEKFREFWGEKSELRRFQDGSITETCVWKGNSIVERRTIVKQIVNYLMQFKYGIQPCDVFHVGTQLDSLLTRKCYSADDHLLQLDECSLEVVRGFDDLRRDVRALTNIPLDVSAVYGTSAVFSYCDPLPPIGQPGPRNPWQKGSACLVKTTEKCGLLSMPEYVPVCKAVIELGHSGKWPGDIEAFRCLKAAFHLQIAEQLNNQFLVPTQAYPNHVDVYKNGFVYRLEIAHPKEITLVRKEVENGVVKMRENEESISLQRETVLMPRVRGALHGLHQKCPAFGAAACLLQRFVSCQLLSGHVPDMVLQLITASVFLNPAPNKSPNAPLPAFVRALQLLADKDWANEMLLLDFNDDMTREQISELERQLSSRDESSPPMCIATSYDGDLTSVWTRAMTPLVTSRLVQLARSTLKYIEKALLEDMQDHVLNAFVPSLAGYDVTIHLFPSLVPYCGERVDKQPVLRKLVKDFDTKVIPVVEFNPQEKYVDELKHAYGDFALFFHDKYGGETIAVLWKPDIHQVRDFQLTNANALHPVVIDGETKYKVNIKAIIEDFKIMGQGLVKEVKIYSDVNKSGKK